MYIYIENDFGFHRFRTAIGPGVLLKSEKPDLQPAGKSAAPRRAQNAHNIIDFCVVLQNHITSSLIVRMCTTTHLHGCICRL